MTIVVFGVEDNQCHSCKGFRKDFASSKDADLYIQTLCNRTKRKDLHRYAMYIGNEFTTLDAVMHLHNWEGRNSRFTQANPTLHKVDMEAVKNYVDVEYANHLRRQQQAADERVHRVNSMDKAAIDYHRELFKAMEVNLL